MDFRELLWNQKKPALNMTDGTESQIVGLKETECLNRWIFTTLQWRTGIFGRLKRIVKIKVKFKFKWGMKNGARNQKI
jgi:hypothetical protein